MDGEPFLLLKSVNCHFYLTHVRLRYDMCAVDLPEDLPNRSRLLQRERSDIDLCIERTSFPPQLTETEFAEIVAAAGCQQPLMTPDKALAIYGNSSRKEQFCNIVVLVNGPIQNTTIARAWLLRRFTGTAMNTQGVLVCPGLYDLVGPFL